MPPGRFQAIWDRVSGPEHVVVVVVVVVVRYRRARGAERQQLKWFAYVGLVVLAFVLLALSAVLFPGPEGGWRDAIGAVGWFGFLVTALIGIPAATGVAILRHRLLDIDVVISRTLVYAPLTLALLGVYVASVLVLQLALRPFTGDSDLAVAVSTLVLQGGSLAWVVRRLGVEEDREEVRREELASLAQLLLDVAGSRIDEVDGDLDPVVVAEARSQSAPDKFTRWAGPAGPERLYEIAGEVAEQRIFPEAAGPVDEARLEAAGAKLDTVFAG